MAVWQLVTELKKEKTGNARETAMEVPAEDLGKADGTEKLIAQLDKDFLRDDKDK